MVSASKNSAGIIADVLLHYTTPSFEALTNILSVVSPQIIKSTNITVEFIGTLSTFNMLCYAGGQLVNGIVRTSVVFWVPTYLSQYLGFSTGKAATAFTIMSYGAAGLANILFANAIAQIGWGNLILVWAMLMGVWVMIAIPKR